MRTTMVVRTAKTTTRPTSRKPEPPIQEHRQGQQDEERHQRGEMLAEEAQPEPRHAVRAFQHHLQHASRMGRGVEGERQFEHVLEIIGHHGKPPAVGEPVRIERDQHAGADGEERECHPGDDQRHQDREGHGRRAGTCARVSTSMMRPNRMGSAKAETASATLASASNPPIRRSEPSCPRTRM